jgi:hypothetical protein
MVGSNSYKSKFQTKPPPVVSPDDVEFMHDFMYKVCDEAGFRTPGSEGEKKGAELFKTEYQKYTDEVFEEKFKCSPRAYPEGGIRPIGWVFLICVVLFFVFPVLSWIVLIPIILWALELFGLQRILDWMYPQKESQNIYAKLKPKYEAKRIILFAGHNDSPLVFPITANLRKKAMPIIIFNLIFALAFVAFGIVRAVIAFNKSDILVPIAQGIIWVDIVAICLAVVSIPGVMWISQTFVSKKKCLGANDNLSGAISALALARYFKEHRPNHIELWFVAFGAEEAGQRGSTEFVLRHREELHEKDAYIINLECVGGGTYLLLATKETMCIPPVPHQSEVYNLLKEASLFVDVHRQVHRSDLVQGYTDAEPFSRYGIKATSIVGLMPDGFPKLWHIETDTPENIDYDCMRDAVEICIKAVKIEDNKYNAEFSELEEKP